MTGVLFTHCIHLFFGRKQVRKTQPYPPLQTLLAAACLRSDGWQTGFFDSTLQPAELGFGQALREQSPELLVICEDHFRFLTTMCLPRTLHAEVDGAPVEEVAAGWSRLEAIRGGSLESQSAIPRNQERAVA